ncbi:nidogen-like isoform X2 [Ostrea edulis]|nr:nidogen-like isoform X2 [Ostrea edulis]
MSKPISISLRTAFNVYGIQYTARIGNVKTNNCSQKDIENVRVNLICGWESGSWDTCYKGKKCRQNYEVCKDFFDDWERLCTRAASVGEACYDERDCIGTVNATRYRKKIHESCRTDKQCTGTPKAVKCRYVEEYQDNVCACSGGLDWVNGDCIKPKRKLLEFCNEEEQCDSDFQCKRIGERNVCSCQEGFEIFNGKCLQVDVSLGDDCEDDRQCTSIECAKCVYNETIGNHSCACEEKCIQNGSRCLLSNRRLYESCEVSKQCRGTLNAKECRYVEGIKLCHCPDGYAVFGGICLEGGVSLRGICIMSEQCTGTQNAGTCLYYNEERENVCSCDQGFFEEGEKCLEGNVSSGQSCVESTQCSSNSVVCVQGESTPDADRDKSIAGFTRRLLFVGFGSFVVGVLGTVFVFRCLWRRKRRHERLDIQTQELELNLNAYDVHSEIINESAENNPPRLDEEAVGGLADICSACHHVHHIEISEVPVQNVSDVTECESPDDRDTYSHLAGWRKDCV